MITIRKLVSVHKSSLVPGEPQFNLCDEAVMVRQYVCLRIESTFNWGLKVIHDALFLTALLRFLITPKKYHSIDQSDGKLNLTWTDPIFFLLKYYTLIVTVYRLFPIEIPTFSLLRANTTGQVYLCVKLELPCDSGFKSTPISLYGTRAVWRKLIFHFCLVELGATRMWGDRRML